MVKFGKGKPCIFESADECETDQAAYDLSLSHMDLDESTSTFVSTWDKAMFESPVAMVEKVLGANGYVLNLENMLSALDQMKFAIRARVPGDDKGDKPKVRSFLPAITFGMPSRTKIGPVLQRFYDEIKQWEATVASLKPAGKAADMSPEEMRREIARLRRENDQLAASVASLSERLARAGSGAAEQRVVETGVLPENLRLARVQGLRFGERQIILRSGRTNYQLPLSCLPGLPAVGDACLVALDSSRARDLFFHEARLTPFTTEVATVLHTEKSAIKVRTAARRTLVIHGKSPAEREMITGAKRGDRLLLSMAGEKLAAFRPMAPDQGPAMVDRMNDHTLMHRIAITWQPAEDSGDEPEEDAA